MFPTMLAQLPLVRSPHVQFPQPISLPRDYHPVPDVYVPALDFAAVAGIRSRAAVLVQRVHSRVNQANEAFSQWRAVQRERELAQARKIAPGYLDSDRRLLTPSRSP